MELFGNILTDDNQINYPLVKKYLERPVIKPRYRVSVLTPDEKVSYTIDENDIVSGGINYTESYQNGQRKNFSLELINIDGKYTPSINGLWVNDRFRLDVGIEIDNGDIIWFPKRIYIMGDSQLNNSSQQKTITIQMQDKYAIFEGKTGTLDTAYEVENGSNIYDALKGILNFTTGNGYIMDYQDIIFDPSFYAKKTQSTIRVEQGDNLGSVIDALATQLSAEYYYNNIGNLCFYPLNETVDDTIKPIIWTYSSIGRDLHNINLNYSNEEIINTVKVVGNNIDNGVYSAIVENTNPASPICVQKIGKRMSSPYSEENIWSNDLAGDLARYYLRKGSFISTQFSCDVSFNPILSVNNLCEVEDDFLNLKRDKLLLTSISFTSNEANMQVQFCNTEDLPN